MQRSAGNAVLAAPSPGASGQPTVPDASSLPMPGAAVQPAVPLAAVASLAAVVSAHPEAPVALGQSAVPTAPLPLPLKQCVQVISDVRNKVMDDILARLQGLNVPDHIMLMLRHKTLNIGVAQDQETQDSQQQVCR